MHTWRIILHLHLHRMASPAWQKTHCAAPQKMDCCPTARKMVLPVVLLLILVPVLAAESVFGRKEGVVAPLSDLGEVDAACDTARADPIAEWCCRTYMTSPSTKIGVSWGALTQEQQTQWGQHRCDALEPLLRGARNALRHRLRPVPRAPWLEAVLQRQRTARLEFVHITKTAGTAIEMAAGHAGIRWGSCHYWSKGHSETCGANNPEDRSLVRDHRDSCPVKYKLPAWHLPPQCFPEALDPYAGRRTFLVVRNPFDRMLSEYRCPWTGHAAEGGRDVESTKSLNAWIQRKIKRVPHRDGFRLGHGIPMHWYAYKNGQQIVDHVLHFENLSADFARLMQRYALNISLPVAKVNTHQGTAHSLSVHDFDATSRQLIRDYYADDFRFFRYNVSLPEDVTGPEPGGDNGLVAAVGQTRAGVSTASSTWSSALEHTTHNHARPCQSAVFSPRGAFACCEMYLCTPSMTIGKTWGTLPESRRQTWQFLQCDRHAAQLNTARDTYTPPHEAGLRCNTHDDCPVGMFCNAGVDQCMACAACASDDQAGCTARCAPSRTQPPPGGLVIAPFAPLTLKEQTPAALAVFGASKRANGTLYVIAELFEDPLHPIFNWVQVGSPAADVVRRWLGGNVPLYCSTQAERFAAQRSQLRLRHIPLVNGKGNTRSAGVVMQCDLGPSGANASERAVRLSSPVAAVDVGVTHAAPGVYGGAALCSSVLRGTVDAQRLFVWVQYYLLLGIAHTYIYVREQHNVAALRTLFDGRRVTIVHFNSTKAAHGFGSGDQEVGNAHCHYTFGPRHNWLGFFDTDEFLHVVADAAPNPTGSLRRLLEVQPPDVSVLSFYSVMFAESGCAAAPFDRLGQTLRWHDHCQGKSSNRHWRHKVFFRPLQVLWVGVHWVMENDGSLLGGKYLTLPTSVAYFKHTGWSLTGAGSKRGIGLLQACKGRDGWFNNSSSHPGESRPDWYARLSRVPGVGTVHDAGTLWAVPVIQRLLTSTLAGTTNKQQA